MGVLLDPGNHYGVFEADPGIPLEERVVKNIVQAFEKDGDFIINEFVVSEILRFRKRLMHNVIHTTRRGYRWLHPVTVSRLML